MGGEGGGAYIQRLQQKFAEGILGTVGTFVLLMGEIVDLSPFIASFVFLRNRGGSSLQVESHGRHVPSSCVRSP